ncbi:MAG: type II toxin-antitoxin system Phd/YefM family antitoxin [bacterium]|nr:type II toxin-antitoxin system Phd/YefM family antitoxin [bacterium]
MKSKTTISISEARKKIFDIAEYVQKPNNYYTLTEKGRPKAVLMSVRDFEDIMEDLEVLSDPGLIQRIKEAEDEIKAGDYVTLDELEEQFQYKPKGNHSLVADKGGKNYQPTKNTRHIKKKK